MTHDDILLVQSSWQSVMPARKAIAEVFYQKLFDLDPTLRTLIAGDSERLRAKFLQVMTATIRGLDQLDTLRPALRELGVRQASSGVHEAHHAAVASALLWTLEKALRADFKPEIQAAWIRTYGVLSQSVREAVAAPQAA